ncbi:MAG: ABC transporter permease, partial [Chitinophagaceae bacterium]
MLRNFFKIAFRNMKKSKGYTLINVLGLAVGLAVSMLIAFWINDEITYDQTFSNYSRIAQLKTTQVFNEKISTHTAVSIPMASELRNKYASDFKEVSLGSWNFGHVLASGDKKINIQGMAAEAPLPRILSLKMLQGSRDVLDDPSSILINRSLATT